MRKFMYAFLMLLSACMFFLTLMIDMYPTDKLFFGIGAFGCFVSSLVLLKYDDR